ncbi:hypothetical protein LZ012_10500 [Dechloromonas sp. XY25]|uniref:Secreted protein n=1 Tax=Dechloromonas hankyongensis TaxID=2908002 RepID=A0ABS9K2L4_9RHOO|nr:hypothetical protein [Dechloromonas hankyongensis]MCG2577422.1 hypothetical protein [Dechloromonas hankyongensis]
MRRLFAVAVATLFSLTVQAAEPVSEDTVSFVDATAAHADVTITPIPMPAQVTELLAPLNPAAKLSAAKKIKQAKKAAIPATLLSRTERQQLALVKKARIADGNPARGTERNAEQNDEGHSDYDDLALHQFYSRPRLVKDTDHQDDGDSSAIAPSETARVRLLMARLKALEAHALAQVHDDGEALSGAVMDRLQAARLRAVEAHQKKFA